MLIILKKGQRDFHRICIEQAANPQQVIRDFADLAFNAMSERHHQEFFHLLAEPERERRPVEFFAYQQIGAAILDPRIAMVDFS